MNATTPPKLMPPFHSAAARGTLPIEQTKLRMAMSGPTTAFSTEDARPWPLTKMCPHRASGTTAASRPATVNPITSSRRSMVMSAIA